MKKFIGKIAGLVAVAACVMSLNSCSKDSVGSYEGRYSYKVSGKVALLPTAYVNASDQEKEMMAAAGVTYEKVWVALYPEQGQMHLSIKDKDQKILLLTLNDITGNVCSAVAAVDGDSIEVFADSDKTASLTNGSEKIAGGFVSWGGSGNRYGEQILISLDYQGRMTVDNVDMTIVDSSVECVAIRN